MAHVFAGVVATFLDPIVTRVLLEGTDLFALKLAHHNAKTLFVQKTTDPVFVAVPLSTTMALCAMNVKLGNMVIHVN